jgi:hypothetical protein
LIGLLSPPLRRGVRGDRILCSFIKNWYKQYIWIYSTGSSWETGGDNNRVQRGGSGHNDAVNCRSANRDRSSAGNRYRSIGFRVVSDFRFCAVVSREDSSLLFCSFALFSLSSLPFCALTRALKFFLGKWGLILRSGAVDTVLTCQGVAVK